MNYEWGLKTAGCSAVQEPGWAKVRGQGQGQLKKKGKEGVRSTGQGLKNQGSSAKVNITAADCKSKRHGKGRDKVSGTQNSGCRGFRWQGSFEG